jgi:adenosylhomocysteine nucleosidase
MIGIIAAMDSELDYFFKQITSYKVNEIHKIKFYTFKLFEKEIVLVQSGIGKVQAAFVATLLLSQFSIDLLINTGSFGAVSPYLHLYDIVVADKLLYSDADVRAFGYAYGQMCGKPKYFTPSINLIKKLTFKTGTIVSGDSFISNFDTFKELINTHFADYNVVGVDMESTSIAHVCYNFNVLFLIVRAVSDKLDFTSDKLDFDTICRKCSVNLYNFIVEIIRGI